MAIPTRDWLRKDGAFDLARQIEDYWAKQGKRIRTRVEPFGRDNHGGNYSIRSDMLAGSPRPR